MFSNEVNVHSRFVPWIMLIPQRRVSMGEPPLGSLDGCPSSVSNSLELWLPSQSRPRADWKHPPISKLRNLLTGVWNLAGFLKLQYEFLLRLMFFNDTVLRRFSLFEFVKNLLTKLQLKKQSRSWESNENYWRAIQHCRLSVGRGGGVALIKLVAGKVHELL